MDPSIKDVARVSGTSIGTVSNVLNHPERVSPATQDRVNQAIARLGYVRNDAARQLRAGRSSTLGLALPASANPFFAEVARGAETAADELDLRLIVGTTGETGERESRYLELFEQFRVRGVLLAPVSFDPSRLEPLRRRGTPVVLVDQEDPTGHFPAVTVDDHAGGYLAATHLIERGCTRILFVGAKSWTQQVTLRFEGATKAVGEHPGVSLSRVDVDEMTVAAGRDIATRVVEGAVGEAVDGIFAGNDLIALGIIQTFVMSRHLSIPDQVRLVGYDDIDFAQSAIVPLSSIRQPAFELGRASVEMLVRYIDNPALPAETVRFQPELVIRSSS